jgi:hypothetical protein
MDQNEKLHIEWIGMAQPEGLVVTSATLKAAEANITWPVTDLQETLREQISGKEPAIADLPRFFRDILGWSDDFVASGAEIPASLRVTLEGSEPLVPQYAVKSADDEGAFVLLVGEAGTVGGDLDAAGIDKRWTATPHQRFERLLRETGVHVGLLTNGRILRLVYAPRGETAGWITFRLHEMLTVDGRPLLGALHMLLNQRRLLTLEADKRLTGLLKASREYQNTVSSALREQVLSALRALLVGFQNADRLAEGTILSDYRGHMGEIYKGLVTVLMRSVFVLFAEEQNLLPIDRALYADSYSLTRLYAQLVEDRDRYGDTIEDRYGAWARIVSLFRLLHDGVKAADGLYLPARRGDFFNPDAFPFLEGRPRGSQRQPGQILDLPRVSDGVVFRLLDLLLVLNGERLQYKGLDVEQVGSVYEGLMGFEVEVAEGDSLAVMPEHVVVNLEALLKLGGADRLKQLKELANLDLKDKAGGEVKAATTVAALQAALGRRTSARQPGLLPKGSLYLQPGEERRKTGSHYTPKSLTSPIVETTLRPVLERLGPDFTPEHILGLCICDPAMGSGAFLVEACRQLADHLVAAWRRTKTVPVIPLDEDIVLHARRLVAQQCLYGVDKNPLAADLARLSLWLVTFAREHSFTFVDHALRCGDSLVGLSREQISNLSLDIKGGFKQLDLVRGVVAPAVAKAKDLRDQIHAIGDPPDDTQLVQLWDEANEALDTVRFLGDLVISSYLSADSEKTRKKAFEDLAVKVPAWLATGQYGSELKGLDAELREGNKGVAPFHWAVEFPEVFTRTNPGFDCILGNPPFLGGTKISTSFGLPYLEWILNASEGSTGNSDLVAHFFRLAFRLVRVNGALGLVATNTIAQGDTRSSGLGWIRRNGGVIFAAFRRYRWPGAAAVIVSIVHVCRSDGGVLPAFLDGKSVPKITSFLFDKGDDDRPSPLRDMTSRAYVGCKVQGQGFVFADDDPNATSLDEMRRLVKKDPSNASRIFAYVGGEDLNGSPVHESKRHVINFGDASEDEVKRWPDLLAILEAKVKPARAVARPDRRDIWWLYATRVPEVKAFVDREGRCLAVSRVSTHLSFAFIPTNVICPDSVLLLLFQDTSSFCVLQSRVHHGWANFLGSSMKDDLRYTTECVETFPLPTEQAGKACTQVVGQRYYEFRAALMIKNNEGLTKTYNRFHNPEEHSSDILRLRELHAAMDRAVLDAYGWSDILPAYDFREQLDESTRLTWAEDTRDEVLARLLELNRVMAAREAEESAAAEGAKPAKKAAAKKKAKKDEATLALPLGKSDPEGT